jgi:uncharacterized protein YuzE
MSVRIEQYDGGEVLYIALDPDGVWAKSDFPDELVTIDYNAQGGVIGIEVLGSAARSAAKALIDAVRSDESLEHRDAINRALEPALMP